MSDVQDTDGAVENNQSTETEVNETILTSKGSEQATDERPAEESSTTTDGDSEPEGNDQGEADGYAAFELPEGMELDQPLLEKVTPLFTEAKLDQDTAQKFVSMYAEQRQADQDAFIQSMQDAHAQQVEQWTTEAKADKEFGGDKFDENIALAKKGLDAVGSPELTKVFNEFGVGSHPEIIRAFIKVGKMVSEDNPGSSGNATQAKKSDADQFYSS